MKLKHLSTAMILATLPATGVFAAALDRSGQSVSAFLQPGNYFEAGISVLDPTVKGQSTAATGSQNISDMGGDYQFYNAALKLQLTDYLSFGLIYDQPFGADAEYHDSTLFTNAAGNTKVEVDTQNISMLFGVQPIKNVNLYAGGVYQTVKGGVQLRGAGYGGINAFGGYNADIPEDSAAGWLAGIAYQIPEIALKASLTYRSEIEHSVNIKESAIPSANPVPSIINNPALAGKPATGSTDITTPQSVNLDLQTGIMANTVAFANVRWVNWKDFAIRPYAFGVASGVAGPSLGQPNGFDLIAYTDDQISATVGVGRKLNDKWAGNVSVGWDSGAGNPVSTLGPTEGYWNVGLGVQYSPADNYFIAGGVKYFWLGDAKAQSAAQFNTDNYVADFTGNNAIAYGMKIGYKF
ncbi:outer membrane protein transport protein [Acinetobacter junii]|uniref:outer membrane protein transport protein n=1 Tax=Acinetobacter junii TaxID=40215 RepID=UPI001F3570A1|nr:outer membrane protein transport protein [Acinetobacter junii]MCE6004050.1 outer membrane protein transport protein [Acinetobacter junii]